MSAPIILAGVCGGVAAYKAADAVSRLRKAGLDVHVAMTEAATKFVTPLTFAAVSGHRVLVNAMPSGEAESGEELYPHLYPATRADVCVVLAATADMIAKIAGGLGADVVSTSALSLTARCRRIFCPAMNVEMWNQPVVQENVRKLEAMGWIRIGPDSGSLACGMEGAGRLSEPQEIAERVIELARPSRDLEGKQILIISGPTREHFDPVRFIGNPSSGKMGKALAEEAAAAGGSVDFVTGPVARDQIPSGPELHVHPIVSADDMLEKSRELYGKADIVVYAAAVADYRPKDFHEDKLPKKDGDLTIHLEATPDVAATLNQSKRRGQVAIGFALQTTDGVQKAAVKLERKNLDGIILNSLEAMGGETGTYTFIGGHNGTRRVDEWGFLDKRACARRILTEAARLLGKV